MYNYKLTIQYDGTRYRGWQVQGNTPQTIQGKLEAVLSRLAGEPSSCMAPDAPTPASTPWARLPMSNCLSRWTQPPFSVSSTATCLRILQSLPSLLPRSGFTPG